jgi:hypothetical protein
MLTGFLTLAGTLLGLLFYELKRKNAKADDPLNQQKARYEQTDQDLTKRDSLGASAHGLDDLEQLERLQLAASPSDKR